MTRTLSPTRSRDRWFAVVDGPRLRQLRRQHGLSQAELAGKAGISLSTVTRLERRATTVLPHPHAGPPRHRTRPAPGRPHPEPVTLRPCHPLSQPFPGAGSGSTCVTCATRPG